jgi:hypothetical protein
LLIWLVALVVGAAVVITAAYYFDVATESRYFCGVLCHSNTPQYVAQEVSPHADVECGVCHIGPGLLPKVVAKIMGTRELYLQLTNTYERPIEHPVARLKSADVICEQCHSPQQPYEDQIERISRFAPDEENTESRTYVVMRPRGGEGESGVVGAHWHVDNPVWFVSPDEADQQDIPLVEVRGDDGQLVVYEAPDNPLGAAEAEELERYEMDCMDCHNRATHDFEKPEDRVDEALALGLIDSDLPYVKREAMDLLNASYATQDEAAQAMVELASFYALEYPEASREKADEIVDAVGVLQAIYAETTFPEMRLDWESYPDNLGHTDYPGCFRCHDGEHLNADEEPIPNNCTLCHSVPLAVEGDDPAPPAFAADVLIEPEAEPASHSAPDFTWTHRFDLDDTCADCHGEIDYGTDGTSFCANGVCHGTDWPDPVAAEGFAHPVTLEDEHAEQSCSTCHQIAEELEITDCATCHEPPQAHYGQNCADCHTTVGFSVSAASWVDDAPDNPHGIDDVDCTLCHGEGGARPAPASHDSFPDSSCVRCHETTFVAEPTVIPHRIESDDCLACHGAGDLQPATALHRGASNGSCLSCHTSEPIAGVPGIPHPVTSGDGCLSCHGEDRVAELPSGHAGWPDTACLSCHQPDGS